MPFALEALLIPDVVLIRPRRYEDHRGSFSETYRRSAFRNAGIMVDFVQDNVVHSKQNVLRGLHYQLPPSAQGKLIAVMSGHILDVAVDLRSESAWKGKWVAQDLTAEGGEMLWVPEGFAHGYLVLSETASVAYKVTAEYAPALERGIRWDDPEVGVNWPLEQPVLSERDAGLPFLGAAEIPF